MFAVSVNAATFTVTNTTDDGSSATCLRQVIIDAVANEEDDTINFNIPDSDPGYTTDAGQSYWKISVTSVLPALDPSPSGNTYSITIDGTTQTTNRGDTNLLGPEIMIDGTNAGANESGISISTDDCVIRNITICNFGNEGIVIIGSENAAVYGCYIGVDATGEAAQANGNGVVIDASTNCLVGSNESSRRNIISGNTETGITIMGEGGSGNRISGNYIGTNRSGTSALGNGVHGISIAGTGSSDDPNDNQVEGNVISGNTNHGINMDASASNDILGNYIGVNAAGDAAIANGESGITIFDASPNNAIGDGTSSGRNVISGNTTDGISISDAESEGCTIKGNYIGVNAAGDAAIANGEEGIDLSLAVSIEVGGTSSGDRNIISGNAGNGLIISETSNTLVYGNYFGLDAAGTAAIGNGANGIYISGGSANNLVGDGTTAGRNVMSANGDNGIEIVDSGTNSNEVNNNYLGLDANGAETAGMTNTSTAIYHDDNARYTKITNSRIKNDGIAIVIANGVSDYEISNNIIIGAGITNSFGIRLEGTGTVGEGGLVSTNEVRGFHVGIYADTSSSKTVDILHNTLVSNNDSTNSGAGVQVDGGLVDIKNCIIATDPTETATPSASIGIQADGGTTSVSYSDIYGNSNNYSGTGTITKTATIHAKALFTDSANDDYTLLFNSPCINTGTPEGADMGMYQYTDVTPEVRVISPNGGENWQEESTQTITWTTTASANTYDLYYSTDSGVSYTAITTGLSNVGTYSWTLPSVDSSTSRVRVVANGTTYTSSDESDADFTISSKSVQVEGEVMTRPKSIKPQQGQTTKIAYNLSTQADIRILLISKYGKVHWNYFASAGSVGAAAGYNEVTFDGKSILIGETVPNGIYMIKIISQNRVLESGHLVVID